MKGIIKALTGIFTINGKGENDLTKILDAQTKCCGGWNCCKQVLIGTDHTTGKQMVGYFKGGAWTVKTLEDFDTNGA